MIEFAALFLSVLSISWARKSDISKSLMDDESLEKIRHALRNPQEIYLRYLRGVLVYTRYYIQRREKSFFALFFISTVSASLLYSMSWSFNDSSEILANSNGISIERWKKELIFLSLLILSVILYVINKHGSKFEQYLSFKSVKALIVLRLFASFCVSASIYYSTQSAILCALVLVTSALCALFPMQKYDEKLQLMGSPLRFGFAAAFGPVALLSVAYSVLAAGQHLEARAATAAAAMLLVFALVSGLSAALGVTKADKAGRYNALPSWARASAAMGLHITDCLVGFAIAVAIAGFFPAVLAKWGITTASISAGVLLTCSIFAAGARTLAGSGLVISVVITLTSVLFFLVNLDSISLSWIESLLFWIVIPVINSSFNFMTTSVTRYFLRFIFYSRTIVPFFFMMDLIFACVLLVLQISALILMIVGINSYLFGAGVSFLSVDPYKVVEIFTSNPFGEGMWLTLMIFGTLVPTLVHFIILLLGGISQFSPKSLRVNICQSLNENTKRGKKLCNYDSDVISWKLTIFDPVSGAVLFVAIGYVLIRILGEFTVSVGQGMVSWTIFSIDNLSADISLRLIILAITLLPVLWYFSCLFLYYLNFNGRAGET